MLELAGPQIDAISIAGMETCIQLPRFDLCFDIGRCPQSAINQRRVLFTHAHIDHMGSVVHHCATRHMQGMKPAIYHVPHENFEAFHDMLAVWRRLDHSELPCDIVPVSPGDAFFVRPNVEARAFRSPHRAPCVGYGLWEHKKKLRPDLKGLTGPQIGELVRAGEDVNVTVVESMVAFTGDSTIDVIEREEACRKARLLIMEVTFLDERVSVEQTRSKGHIHLDEVLERADLFVNDAILFTHLSARYGVDEARDILARRLPPSLRDRVTILLEGR